MSVIFDLVLELAAFERLGHLVNSSAESLRAQLCGRPAAAESLVATVDGTVVGFAVFCSSFSAFLGRPGLLLDTLYVQADHRRHGIGRALLRHLAQLALDRGCGRLEWQVLDWNARAISLYESMGARVMPEWRLCRVTADGLHHFAHGSQAAGT